MNSLTRLFRRQPLGVLAAVILVAVWSLAILGPISGLDAQSRAVTASVLKPPSAAHWLGTDELGRDVLARIIVGSRATMVVGFGAVAVATVVSVVVAVGGGFIGGKLDLFLQRLIDAVSAVPTLMLALVASAALGFSVRNVIVAVAIGLVPGMSRVMRASVLSLREMPYIEAARSTGCSMGRLMVRHIGVNIVPILLVVATSSLGQAIIAEASLGFLGFGVPAPTPSWGRMLSGGGQEFLRSAPWLGIFPGLAIVAVVLAANFVGDALRDELDPRLRNQ